MFQSTKFTKKGEKAALAQQQQQPSALITPRALESGTAELTRRPTNGDVHGTASEGSHGTTHETLTAAEPVEDEEEAAKMNGWVCGVCLVIITVVSALLFCANRAALLTTPPATVGGHHSRIPGRLYQRSHGVGLDQQRVRGSDFTTNRWQRCRFVVYR